MNKQAKVQVHETDDYLKRQASSEQDVPKSGDSPEEARLAARARHIFPPLATGIMVGCIAYAIAEFTLQLRDLWQGMPYFLIPVIAAFVGYVSFHTVRIKFMSSNDRLRYLALQRPKLRRNARLAVDGLRLRIPPGVFHPAVFRSGLFLAEPA